MTGQELLKLKELDIFKEPVMDTIINEFVPDADAFKLTDAFLPIKLVEKSKILDLIQHGAFGTTNPVNLDSDHKLISIPGNSYKEHTAGHWREGVQYGEEVLQEAIKPENPKERMGEALVTKALDVLDLRLNNLIEKVTAKLLITGKYSEARYGVNYEYDPKIPAKFMKDVTSTPGWTTGGTWATASAATPVADIIGAMIAMRNSGLEPEKAYMSVKTMEQFYGATHTQTMVKASPQLVEGSANRARIFNTLTGIESEIDSRTYAEETRLTAASAANDTTLDVENAAEFAAGDVITIRGASGQEEEATIDSITGNVITLVAGVTNSYLKGARVTVYKPFLPDGYVLFKARSRNRLAANNWLSTPSIVKSKDWKNPQPGRYTWTYFQGNRPPYWLEVGAGISGGPKISSANFLRMKVIA